MPTALMSGITGQYSSYLACEVPRFSVSPVRRCSGRRTSAVRSDFRTLARPCPSVARCTLHLVIGFSNSKSAIRNPK